MMNILLGVLFLSGLPICMFLLPGAWWPWSTFVWFVGFIALERLLRRVARAWRGRPRPAGAAGVVIAIAIAIDDGAGAGDGSDGGDGGGDGGGGGD